MITTVVLFLAHILPRRDKWGLFSFSLAAWNRFAGHLLTLPTWNMFPAHCKIHAL